MFRNISLFTLIIFTLSSCLKDNKTITEKESYFLTITTESDTSNKVYLQKLVIVEDIDSTLIENGNAYFKGSVETPQRYLITIDGYFGGKMIVLENDSITVSIKNKDLINSNITGSKLNKELLNVQTASEKIYSKIDVLFPDMQIARLNNDAEKLQEISKKMTLIEQENIDFNFKYVKENPDSYISAMILSDLARRDSIETKKITDSYNSLSENVKKSVDAQKVAAFISGLH